MYISGVYIGQYKVLLELYLGAVPWASGSIYACTKHALVAGHEHGRMCVLGHACPWGWMDGWLYIVWSLAYYLSYVEVWEQGMVHVMLVP